jgi:hypothetical protein
MAMKEVGVILGVMSPEGREGAFAPGRTAEERTRLLRDAYLGSEDALRLLVPALERAMGAEGLSCDGCPRFEARAARHVSWEEIRPYVTAYFWPDPVRTPPDGGKPRYGFHVCGGLNGVGEIENADPLLVRAGLAAAFRTEDGKSVAFAQFEPVLEEDGFRALTDDEARTRYLRRRVQERLSTDPGFRAALCGALEETSHIVGVVVDGCWPIP